MNAGDTNFFDDITGEPKFQITIEETYTKPSSWLGRFFNNPEEKLYSKLLKPNMQQCQLLCNRLNNDIQSNHDKKHKISVVITFSFAKKSKVLRFEDANCWKELFNKLSALQGMTFSEANHAMSNLVEEYTQPSLAKREFN